MLAALAALPFLPKVAAKHKVPELVDDMGYGLSGCYPPIPVGTIEPFSLRDEEDVPEGWLPCDGRVISQCQHPALCEVLGDNKVPNLNSRKMMHAVPDDPERPWLCGSHAEPLTQLDYDAYCGIRYMIKAK